MRNCRLGSPSSASISATLATTVSLMFSAAAPSASVGMGMLPAGSTVPHAAAGFPLDWHADMGVSVWGWGRGLALQCAGVDAQAPYSGSAAPAAGVAPWRKR